MFNCEGDSIATGAVIIVMRMRIQMDKQKALVRSVVPKKMTLRVIKAKNALARDLNGDWVVYSFGTSAMLGSMDGIC